MSGGSFDYLCDATGAELAGRTLSLQDMAEYLREFQYEPEAQETQALIGKINRFHDELTARANDLRPVWKAAEWFRSNDWDRTALTGAVMDHRASHPEASVVPGLMGLAPNPWRVIEVTAKTPTPSHKPESLDDGDDYRWAEDQDQWAVNFTREELEWIQWAAGDAIRIQEDTEEKRKAEAEEEARWDRRRAELIEKFNGGPLNVANGQPIPTMALQAVEYIIETERNAEKGQA